MKSCIEFEYCTITLQLVKDLFKKRMSLCILDKVYRRSLWLYDKCEPMYQHKLMENIIAIYNLKRQTCIMTSFDEIIDVNEY